jgi:hypothetical protein
LEPSLVRWVPIAKRASARVSSALRQSEEQGTSRLWAKPPSLCFLVNEMVVQASLYGFTQILVVSFGVWVQIRCCQGTPSQTRAPLQGGTCRGAPLRQFTRGSKGVAFLCLNFCASSAKKQAASWHQGPMVDNNASSVAVLFASWVKVSVPHAGANTKEHLVDALGADVHLYLTFRSDDNCDSVESCGVREWIARLGPITTTHVERQLTTSELATRLQAMPTWPALWRSLSVGFENNPSLHVCVRRNVSAAALRAEQSPFVCPGMKEGGNSFFAPVLGRPDLNVMRQLYMQSRVLHWLREHERTTRGGVAYKHVVWSRLEFYWLATHLPLHRPMHEIAHPRLEPVTQPTHRHSHTDGRTSIGALAGECELWVPIGEDCRAQARSNARHKTMRSPSSRTSTHCE